MLILLMLSCCLVLPAADEVDEMIADARRLEELGEFEMAARKWGQALDEAEGDLLAEQRVSDGVALLLRDDPDSLRALGVLGELDPKHMAPMAGAAPLATLVLRESVRRGSLEQLGRASQVLIDHAKAKGTGDVADLLGEWGEGMFSLTRFEAPKAIKRLQKAWTGLLKLGALEDGLHVGLELALQLADRRDEDEAYEVLETTLAALAAFDDVVLLERWTLVAEARLADAPKALRRAAGLSEEQLDADDESAGTAGAPGAPGARGADAGEDSPAWTQLGDRGRGKLLFSVERDDDHFVLTSGLDDEWRQELPLGPGVVSVRHGGLELLFSGPSVALGAVHRVAPSGAAEPLRERPLGRHFVALADGETWRLDTRGALSVR